MKRYIKTVVVLLALVTSFFLSCSPSEQYLRKRNIQLTEDLKDIRVLLLKTKTEVVIGSTSKAVAKDLKTGKIVAESQKMSLKLTPDNVNSALFIESWDSPLAVNGQRYRGTIEVHNKLGTLNIINVVSMNDYLKGVVPSEIPASWPTEALKAQAVAARTYCYYHMSKKMQGGLYNLDSTTKSQVYKGVAVEKPATTKAVEETSGIIITENSQPIIAYFHSTCGGKTTGDQMVWSGDGHDYLQGVSCKYCSASPHSTWETLITINELTKALQTRYKNIDKITNISFVRQDSRVVEVKISYNNGSIRMKGNDFRLMLSAQKVKSLYFASKKQGNGLFLKGRGWGHGVGMCQWGAKGMADAGMGYKNIISHYYQGIRLVKISRANEKAAARNLLDSPGLSNVLKYPHVYGDTGTMASKI